MGKMLENMLKRKKHKKRKAFKGIDIVLSRSVDGKVVPFHRPFYFVLVLVFMFKRHAFAPPPFLSPCSGPVRLEHYNETLVNRMLGVLRPEPVDYSAATPFLTVLAKDFERSANEQEKWYGTRYQVTPQKVYTYSCGVCCRP